MENLGENLVSNTDDKVTKVEGENFDIYTVLTNYCNLDKLDI